MFSYGWGHDFFLLCLTMVEWLLSKGFLSHELPLSDLDKKEQTFFGASVWSVPVGISWLLASFPNLGYMKAN